MRLTKTSCFVLLVLLISAPLFQAQTFYGKRQTGYFTSEEDGSAFGYYVPRSVNQSPKKCPLVVFFGHKATNALLWKDIAERDGLVVLSIQPWQGGRWFLPNDFVRAEKKVKEMLSRYPVDPKRVWSVGYGFDGNNALAVAINNPGLFTAAAGVDAKLVNFVVLEGGDQSASFLGVIHFSEKPEGQIPLFFGYFSGGTSVIPSDVAETQKVVAKYKYPASYHSFAGASRFPDSKMIGEVYSWFKKSKVVQNGTL